MRGTEQSYSRLCVYDTVPECAAERMLAFWRTQRETQGYDKAAE